MSPASTDLYGAAETLLSLAANAVATTPGGPIDYRAIIQGLPVFDCPPAIYVSAGQVVIGDTLPLSPSLNPLQRITHFGIVDLPVFAITVIRCVSTITRSGNNILLPSAAELSEDAYICYADLWAVWNALVHAHHDGTLFQRPSRSREFGIDGAQPVRTEGGAGGWVIQVRFQLDGYDPGVTP